MVFKEHIPFQSIAYPGFLLVLVCVLTVNLAYAQINFNEEAKVRGIYHSYVVGQYTGAATFYDFNDDGWDDVTLATGTGDSIIFLKNDSGNLVQLPSLVSFTGEAKSVIWVDYDNDGDSDLYISSRGHTNRLYNNDGNLNLTDVTSASLLPLDSFPSFGANWADIDNNGYLDLYFVNRSGGAAGTYTNYLYRNNGDGTFINNTVAAGVGDGYRTPLCAAFFDADIDGDQDLYTIQEKPGDRNSLFENLGNGIFNDISSGSGADIDVLGMGVAIEDYNRDGLLDIYVTNGFAGNVLLKNTGSGSFVDVTAVTTTAMNGFAWACNFLDGDNDGFRDLYVSGIAVISSGKSSAFFRNDNGVEFSELIGIGMQGDSAFSYSNAIGDINNDGYQDILVVNEYPDSCHLWVNSGGDANYLKIDLEGTISNRDGVGALVELYLDSTKYIQATHCGMGFLGQNSSSIIFGLGTDTIADSLIVNWPSGIVDHYYSRSANQTLSLVEGEVACINPIVITSSKQNVDCSGTDNGSAQIFVTGGKLPYSFVWNTNPESYLNSVSGLSGGIYKVDVLDANNCKNSVSISVFEPSSVFVSAITNFPNVGDVNLLVSGGIAPYTYNWSNGSTSEDVSGLAPGFYFVQVADRNGCAQVYIVNL